MSHPATCLLLLAALVGLGACKKIDLFPTPAQTTPLSQLPPATQTGQRTFGCLLNGQAWRIAGNPFAGPVFTTHFYNGRLGVSASRDLVLNGVTISQHMGFSIDNVTLPGRYTLAQRDTSFVGYRDYANGCQYMTDKAHPAVVTITKLDFVTGIVSGTFSFTLETPGCDKVVVTDGRFDSYL